MALLAAAIGVTLPFFTDQLVGGVDARWYAYMLKDFLSQIRAGHFPVWVGQGRFAWNGGVHPFRSAPAYMHVAGLWDLLTFGSLDVISLQHLAIVTSAVAGVLGFYAAGIALAPRRRWEVWLLSLLYLSAPAWLSIIYWSDAYMTYMAFAALPLVAYGNARSLLGNDGRGYCALAAGLALVWTCHPPVAMLATLGTLLIQGTAVLCGEIPIAAIRGMIRGVLLFLALSAYYFVSMRDLPLVTDPPQLSDAMQLGGLALALAGLARGVLKNGGWGWLAALAAGEWMLWTSSPPWFWWTIGTVVLAAAAATAARRWRWFDPRERACEILIPCAVLAAALAGAWLGPKVTDIDGPALSALRDNTAAGVVFVGPIPEGLTHEADYRLGPGLWLVLAATGAVFFRKRPIAAKAFFAGAILPAFGLVRVPWVSEFLVGTFPPILQGISNFPFSLRLVPAMEALVAAGGVVWLATETQGRGRGLELALLSAAVVWSGVEAAGFVERGWGATSAAATEAQNFRPENVVLDRYAYDLLHVPSYFSDGETDPRIEVRLLDANQRVVLGPDETARRMEEAGAARLRLMARQNPASPAWLQIKPGLTLGPGEQVLLRFEFDPAKNYAGYLIFTSEHGYREYHLPNAGLQGAFGVDPARTHVISLWNSGKEPEHYKLSMPREPGNNVAGNGGFFANLIVSQFKPGFGLVHLDSLDPFRASAAAEKGGWLETPREFIPGYRATVDGLPAPVACSPEKLVMVPLSPGRHEVDLRYVGTPELWISAGVSAIAWAGFLGSAVWSAARRRRA